MPYSSTESNHPNSNSYDVIIIGGGIIGCALAYFSSQQGKKVLVLEKDQIASKQSGKAWGFVRKQLRNLDEIPIISMSIELWKSLEMKFGEDIYWRNKGGIQLLENKNDIDRAETWINKAEKFQLSTTIIDGKELKRKIPGLMSDVDHAIYTPDDGQVNPYKSVKAFQKAAQALGASFQENITFENINFDDSRFIFSTNKGNYDAEQVVCCAGGGSYFFLKDLGILIPQLAARVTSIKTYPLPFISNSTFLGGGIGFRQDKDGCITLGCQNESNVDLTWRYFVHGRDFLKNKNISREDYSINLTYLFTDESKKELIPKINVDHINLAKARFNKLFPEITQIGVWQSWAEYIDFLPNLTPIIDRHPIIKNLVIATGFSGSGFALGPAVGKLVSELLAYKQPSVDITSFHFPS